LPKFWCQKIEQKNPGGLPVATASYFGRKFLSFGNFSKKIKFCQIFPYKLPKFGKTTILENSHIVQASNQEIKGF
jgi:hypothetical protein